MRRHASILTALLFLAAGLATPAAARRVALVIGNSAYENVPRLVNTDNDAEAVAEAFSRLGFNVLLTKDLRAEAMRAKLAEFAIAAADAEIATIYYAGHGMEVEGKNYIVPVDARLEDVAAVWFELIPLDSIISSMQGTKGLKLVFLDACRDNPFQLTARPGSATRSIGRGLASVEPDAGMVISYAAKAGTVAYDGDGKHSPYTEALLGNIEEPGLELQFLFRRVRDAVLRKTKERQEPFFYGSLPDREFYLRPPAEKEQPVVAAANGIDEAVATWRLIENEKDPALFKAFIEEYGKVNKVYGLLAKKRLADLERTAGGAPIQPGSITRYEPQDAEADAAGDDKSADAAGTASEAPPQQVAALSGSSERATLPVGPDAAGPAAPPDPGISQADLTLMVQEELNRVGCDAGKPDGVWGRNSRQAALAYSRHAGVSLASPEPSGELLIRLRGETGRACPLTCSPREVLRDGACTAKTCPAGQRLSSGGSCYTPQQKTVLSCPAGQLLNSRGQCYTPKARVQRKSGPGRVLNSRSGNERKCPPGTEMVSGITCEQGW